MRRVPVCVFAKPPVPGRVKTRLARVVGDEAAAALARALLADAWEVVSACTWADPVLATTDVTADHGVRGGESWDQGQGDLGARVERILARGVAQAGAACALGADTAGLTVSRLDAVWRALQGAPAALGPSRDGGFWVLALRRCPPGLLAGLPWSAPDTGAATLARVAARLGAVAQLEEGFDVDEVEDLRHLIREVDAGALPAGQAVAVAREILAALDRQPPRS